MRGDRGDDASGVPGGAGARAPRYVISDSNVPGFDIVATLHWVREKHPQIPFLFCSGNKSQALRAPAVVRGATAWVSKDDLPALVAEVKRVCCVKG